MKVNNKELKVQKMRSDLNENEIERYSRQISIPSFGINGQKALKSAKIAVIGAGGLGAPILQYLAAAGVGNISIFDDDLIDESNLQRQVLFREDQVNEKKAVVSAEAIQALNSNIQVQVHDERLHAGNAISLLEHFDLVIDGTDNFFTRYVINDVCLALDIPFIFGSIYQFEGQVSVFNYVDGNGKRGPDYRALFPEIPEDGFIPNCAEGGVIGALPGIIGSIQALEAIKVITKNGEVLSGKLLIVDALTMQFSTIEIAGSENNGKPDATSALERLKKLENEYGEKNEELYCETNSPLIQEITPAELEKLQNKENTQLIDIRSIKDRDNFPVDGLHIPFDELDSRKSEIDKDKVKVVCCNVGQTSKKAIQKLQNQYGIENLLNLKGGTTALMNHLQQTERKTQNI